MSIPQIWKPDGEGVQHGGTVGGDLQVTEAYSVRFVRPDVPGALITVNYYGVRGHQDEDDERYHEYYVEEQTEFLVCTDPSDPGGTETWSETTYDDASLLFYDIREVDREARALAEREDLYGCDWDGKPDRR